MEILEYNDKTTTIEVIRRVLNRGNVEKAAFCGLGLATCITNNVFGRVCLSVVFVRKLYSIYKNNRQEINLLFDRIL